MVEDNYKVSFYFLAPFKSSMCVFICKKMARGNRGTGERKFEKLIKDMN